MAKYLPFCAILIGLAATPTVYGAIVVASEDFDGGATNLITSNVPNQDGGGGDAFAVGSTSAWPTSGGVPFSLVDNTTGDVGASNEFANDVEGIYGVNSNFDNNFLGISDSDEFGNVVATWDFDIAGATDLGLQIAMGSMEGNGFGYDANTLLTFEVSIDGGASQLAFSANVDAEDAFSYEYRALDNGNVISEDQALFLTGDNLVTKFLAEDGTAAGDTFLDKTPSTGSGAGVLDTFATSINGTGDVLRLTLTANVPFDAVAIDNIRITAVPEPSLTGLALLGAFGVAFNRRRKS